MKILNQDDRHKSSKQLSMASENTPDQRSRKLSDMANSNFDLMNKKLLDINHNDASPKLESISENEYSFDIQTEGSVKETLLTRDLKLLQRVVYYFKFFSEFILRDFKTKPLNNVISVSTIVLLLVFLGLINIMMSLSPMIYLMMSEQQVGESDVLFVNSQLAQLNASDFQYEHLFIDYKEISDNYCNRFLKGCSSRFRLKAIQTINTKEIFSDVLLIDVAKEERIGLGRRVQLTQLNLNECYISRNLFNDIKKANKNFSLKTNANIQLDVSLALLLSQIPMLQAEEVNESYNMKRHFIANMIQKKLNDDNNNTDYFSVQDIIYHYYPQNKMSSEERTLLDGFDFSAFMGFSYDTKTTSTPQERQYIICLGVATYAINFKISFHLQVKEIIDNSIGKYEDNLSNVIIVDYKTQFSWMVQQICASIVSQVAESLSHYSMTYYVIFNIKQELLYQSLLNYTNQNADDSFFTNKAMIIYGIYENKQNIYLEEQSIIDQLKLKSNQFSDIFGIAYKANLLFPLSYIQIQNLKQKQILDNSYNSGVVLLIALSSVIIYTVSQSSIQQKVQEYGVVRIIGYSTRSLILFSLAKAILFYMIPALLLAETLNMIIGTLVKQYFYNLLKFSNDLYQEYSSTYYATTVILGVCLPLFCNLYPFKEFFEKQVLSQALNIHQRVLQQTRIIVQKLEKYGISFYSLINSIILVIVGILAYYFAPYAFVTQKIGLFLMIVNLTFLMVNVGVSCLINIVQRKIEISWIKMCLLTCFRADKNLEASIYNNFKNNNLRMSKLGMIIMMIFSFYISIGSSVNSQIMMVKNMVKLNIGSDYLLQVDKPEISLDESFLTEQLEMFKEKNPNIIKQYSFVSKNIKSIIGFHRGAKIKNFLGESANWDILAIDPNFYDSIYSELFIPESPKIENHNPSNSLYFQNGTSIGRFIQEQQLDSKDHFKVISQIRDDNYINFNYLIEHPQEQYIMLYASAKDKKFLCIDYDYHIDFILGAVRFKGMPAGFAKKIPGFKSFTENSIFSLFQSSQAFVSYEQFNHIIQVSWEIAGFSLINQKNLMNKYPKNLSFDIPKDQLFIKLQDDAEISAEQRNVLKSFLLQSYVDSTSVSKDQESISFYETYSILLSLDYLIQFWNLLFNLISLFIFILSYYLLTITFKQNVQENLHNIKIFKSIGLSHTQIQKIFIYEGVTVMLVNGLIGLLVGMLLSIMIQQQLMVFLEMPMDLQQIPYKITIALLILCIALSIFTSKKEIDNLKNKQIAQIEK